MNGTLVNLAAAWLFAGELAILAQDIPILDDARFHEARKLHESGDREKALEAMRRICSETPDSGLNWLAVADYLLVQRRDYAGSLEFALPGFDLLPDLARAHAVLGQCYLFLDRAGDAEALFREATRRFPDHANMWYNLGMASGANRRILEAQSCYERALEIEPEDPLFLVTAAENSLLLHRDADAVRYFRKAAEGTRKHPDAAWKLAKVLGLRGEDEEAEHWFQRAVRRKNEKNRHDAEFQYAVFQFERRRFEEAAALLERCVKARPEDRMAWHYLGRSVRGLGDDARSKECMARYRELQQSEDLKEEKYLLGLLSDRLSPGPGSAEDPEDQDSPR